jgi:nucleoside-diphosphate-sugar epimerase
MFTILGAAGLIGAAIVRHLQSQGHEVRSVTRSSWPDDDEELGHVIYAIGITSDFLKDPLATADAHVSVLARALRTFRYASFLYLSSTRLYMNASSADEDQPISVLPTDPNYLYNACKLAGESICLSLPAPAVRVVRLSNVLAPADQSDAFLASVLAKVRKGCAVTIESSPDSERDYVSIEDVTWLLEAISMRGRHRMYNVAAGNNVSNRTIAELIRRHVGVTVTFSSNIAPIKFPRIAIRRIGDEFQARPMPFEAALLKVLMTA